MCKVENLKNGAICVTTGKSLSTKDISVIFGKCFPSQEECYCGIEDFYRKIAVIAGLNSDKIVYNCTKIHVTKPVQEQIFAFYKEQKNVSWEAVAQTWVLYGPKADIPGSHYEVSYDPGFFMEVTQ